MTQVEVLVEDDRWKVINFEDLVTKAFYETCLQEATQYNTNFASYVQHLTIHGILHLVGYDHSSDLDATLMEDLESQILGNLRLKAHT